MNNPAKKAKSKLQIVRETRGWSRKYVAKEIQVSEYTIGQWERGEHVPYPEHIQKLCNLFGKNAEALGLTGTPLDVESARAAELSGKLEVKQEPVSPIASSPQVKQKRLLIPGIGIVLIIAVAFYVIVYVIHHFSPIHTKPGGEWISPVSPTVGDIIYFAAYAYPTHAGEPEIDHVNFTAFWQGVDPRVWIIACMAHIPVRKDVFACSANLRLLGAQPGRIKISFDVYDRQGNVNFSPNGVHTVTYLPSAAK